MTEPRLWRPVKKALERWTLAGLKAPLWLRDDDAIEPTPKLDRLADLTGRYRIPLALAIVPEPSGEALERWVARLPHLTPVVHGWAHRNHAPAGAKKQEFGLHRPLSAMQDELEHALHKMRSLHGERLVPMFVPPWNRLAPQLTPFLRQAGYTAISAFGPPGAMPQALPEINTHVELIDFGGTRKCRDHGLLAASLAAALDHSFAHGHYAVGVLSHHLVHDEAVFDFLEALFHATAGHDWLTPGRLVERRTGLVR